MTTRYVLIGHMHTVSDIIDTLGGNAAVSRSLGIKPSAVSEMKRRNSIPVRYWRGLVEMAHERERPDIGVDVLMTVHAAQPETGAAA